VVGEPQGICGRGCGPVHNKRGARLVAHPPHALPGRQGRAARHRRGQGRRAGQLQHLPVVPPTGPQAEGAGLRLPPPWVHRAQRPRRRPQHRPRRGRDGWTAPHARGAPSGGPSARTA
jgi:hypothetical protein